MFIYTNTWKSIIINDACLVKRVSFELKKIYKLVLNQPCVCVFFIYFNCFAQLLNLSFIFVARFVISSSWIAKIIRNGVNERIPHHFL